MFSEQEQDVLNFRGLQLRSLTGCFHLLDTCEAKMDQARSTISKIVSMNGFALKMAGPPPPH